MQQGLIERFWNFFVWNTRSVNLEDPNTPINGTTVGELFGGSDSFSGEKVDQKTALNFSAVWRSTDLLSGVISSLPFKPYDKTSSGRRVVQEHPFYEAVTRKPNNIYSKVAFFKRAVIHFLNWGNHVAEIKWNSGTFNLIHPSDVTNIEKSSRGNLVYVIREGFDENGKPILRRIMGSNIIHVPNLGDELWGMGVIDQAKNSIGLAFASEKYGSKFFKSGGSPSGILNIDKSIKAEQQGQIKEFYAKQVKDGGTMTAPAGVSYTPISLPPEAMQFLGTREFSVLEIARWYGIPPEKLAELSRATYGNIEHNSIAFMSDTINPILSLFENEYTNKIGSGTQYFEYDMNAYLRADTQAKAEQYRTGIQNGYMTINEVRQKENLPLVDDGDRPIIQSNMMHLDKLDEIISKGNEINFEENE